MPLGAAAADASSTKTVGGTTPSSAAVTSSTAAVDREVEDVTKKLGSSLGSGGTVKAFNSFFFHYFLLWYNSNTTMHRKNSVYITLQCWEKGKNITLMRK